jgi:chromosome segregation ATPase
MTRTALTLSVLAFAALTWGCARGPDSITQTNKSLESKLVKLQGDLAELNGKVLDLDQRLAKEQARTRAAEQERDALATRLKSRTDERDAVQVQFDGLVKTLESALGQAKAARATLGADATVSAKAAIQTIKVAPGGW